MISRLFQKPLIGLFAAISALVTPSSASALSPYLVVPAPGVAESSPAYRYANMTNEEAFAELDRRKVLYSRVDLAPGVRAPVRLTGRLHGVYIHSALPPEERVRSVYEILDARLLLALDDFAVVLERHGIDELVHYTMYRPNVSRRAHGASDERGGSAVIGRARARQSPHAGGARPASSKAGYDAARAPKKKGASEGPGRAAPGSEAGLGAKGTLDVGKQKRPPGARSKEKPRDSTPKPEPSMVARPVGKERGAPARPPRASAPPARPAATIARRETLGRYIV